MNQKKGPNLAANIRSQKGQDIFLPNQKLSQMFQFKSGIRIGVIGLTTIQTPTTTNAFTDKLFPQYKFLQYVDIVKRQSKKLKEAGANAVLLVTHLGNQCPFDLDYGIWMVQSIQNQCQQDGELSKLIDSLPEGTIDGAVQGHRHTVAHHYRKNVAYMGSINGGYYFNIMYLKFNQNKQIIRKYIQGPIPVCEKIFLNLGKCNYLTKQQIVNAGPLVPWRLHGKQVYAHPRLKQIYNRQWLPKMNPYLQELVINQIPLLQVSSRKQNQLANIITTIIKNALPSVDFVIVNAGGFRTTWNPGVLQYQHFYNMFPFDNYLMSFQISGRQLLDMLNIIQNGEKGFYHTWGIQQFVTFNTTNNKTGFISAKWINGSIIQGDGIYRGVTDDFLLSGGDDFSKVIGKVYKPRNVINEGDWKALLKPELKKLQILQQNTWINPKTPRLILKQII